MSQHWSNILNEHQQVVAALADQGPLLEQIVAAIIAAVRNGGRVYILGNGGSAADAQHIAAELLGRFKRDRAALPALALTTDSSTLTAISNDLGYESVFARQLEGLVRPGDVVWILSTSGRSPNVVAAARLARERGAVVIGFTRAAASTAAAGAVDENPLADHCHFVFRVPHSSSDRIQEAHQLAYHYICERVEAEL